jgi:hypothetical protein
MHDHRGATWLQDSVNRFQRRTGFTDPLEALHAERSVNGIIAKGETSTVCHSEPYLSRTSVTYAPVYRLGTFASSNIDSDNASDLRILAHQEPFRISRVTTHIENHISGGGRKDREVEAPLLYDIRYGFVKKDFLGHDPIMIQCRAADPG